MSEAFLWIDEKQMGPFTFDQVREMLGGGQITADTLCMADGGEWKAVSEAVDLQEPKPIAPTVPIREVSAPFNQTALEWHRWQVTSEKAVWAVGIGVLCAVIGVLCIFIGVLTEATGTAHVEMFAGAGLIGAGFWIAVLGQIMHVRAAVEKMADREG
jgi:hypothetical protein